MASIIAQGELNQRSVRQGLILYVCLTGYDRFAGDIEWMLGFRPGAYWKLTWHLLTPMSIIVSNYHTNLNQYNQL